MPRYVSLEGEIDFAGKKAYTHSLINKNLDNFDLVGKLDNISFNELSHLILKTSNTLPPLGINNIVFNISSDRGILFRGMLKIFDQNIEANCSLKSNKFDLEAMLPKITAPGIEIMGEDHKHNAKLLVGFSKDSSYAKISGILKIGELLQQNALISLDFNGSSFNLKGKIGEPEFAVDVTGQSSGFVDVPKYKLNITFKDDFIKYLKDHIVNELKIIDNRLEQEFKELVSDTNSLAEKILLYEGEPKELDLANWSLNKAKKRLSAYERVGLATKAGDTYAYVGLAKNFDITRAIFSSSADKIKEFALPMFLSFVVLSKTEDTEFVIDFSNLNQSISNITKVIHQRLLVQLSK